MRKTLALCVVLLLGLMTTAAMASTFVNGGFENGNLTGWTQGGGYWSSGWPLDPSSYLPSGSQYSPSYMTNTIVTPGLDPLTGGHLNEVYSGNYAVRVNDSNNNYSVSVISQTVNNYTDPNIYFAWAAVLEGSHGPTDSDNFTLQLMDVTKSIALYNVTWDSADASTANLFADHKDLSGNDWYYTSWQVENLDVSAYQGDTFTLSLLGSDCPYGGHAGYVYLDGFGNVLPPPSSPSNVPEPSSFVLLGSGAAFLVTTVRAKLARRHAA